MAKLTEITACKQCPKMARSFFQKPVRTHWEVVKIGLRVVDIPNDGFGHIPVWCPSSEAPEILKELQ